MQRWVKKSSSHRAVTVALATLLKGDKDVLNIVTDEAIDATDWVVGQLALFRELVKEWQ